MTFNIRNGLADDGLNSWENRKDLTAQVIREARADIVALQEVFEFQLDYLKEQLPEYAVYSVGREDGDIEGEQCSIFWKPDKLHPVQLETFWLSDTPEVPNSMTWGNRITRICSWIRFDEGFSIFNTHFDHESVGARNKSAEMIIQRLPDMPWVLVGDFNAELAWPDLDALRTMSEGRAIDQDVKSGTFHDFKGGSEGDRIDYIFASNHFESSLSHLDVRSENGVFPSDHYAVLATLTLK